MDKNDLLIFVNILLGLVAFFGAKVGNDLTAAIKELRQQDKELAAKLEQYVRRDDLTDLKSQITAMFRKLDDIRDGLANTVKRDECEYHRSKGK